MSVDMPALVVMGVAGCGKSSVGKAIASATGGSFVEGDQFHSPANIGKMRACMPLDDADRADWLVRLAAELSDHVTRGQWPVLACSALKRHYRDVLRKAIPGLGFVFLDLDREQARLRVAMRTEHFMPAGLIDSQFASLESPAGEEATLITDATRPVDDIVSAAIAWLHDPPVGGKGEKQ